MCKSKSTNKIVEQMHNFPSQDPSVLQQTNSRLQIYALTAARNSLAGKMMGSPGKVKDQNLAEVGRATVKLDRGPKH